MRLLQVVAPGRAEWREATVPVPGPGEVLVRIRAVATCPHWDLHIFGGRVAELDRVVSKHLLV
jgi:NADPH:quinone reductase-like Zn-dependent oxidoreductase